MHVVLYSLQSHCFSGQETACYCYNYYTALFSQFQPDTTLCLIVITLLQE